MVIAWQVIDLRYEDKTNVRAFGMHFRDEYFPHWGNGESAIFHLGRIEEALKVLELSISQSPSARAKYYLNRL